MISNWPTPELKAMALYAVEEYSEQLFFTKPVDAKLYGVQVPSPEFYAELLGALCKYESEYNTHKTFVESFKDKNGKPVVSRGLLQLSKESCNGYGAGLTREDELHDPRVNLRCAVLIMNRWIYDDKIISGGKKGEWRGMARYWSPFRKPDRVNAMREKMKSLNQKGDLKDDA